MDTPKHYEPIYDYEQVWSEEPIDSKKFHEVGYDNPDESKWPFKSQTITAKGVQLGNYKLSDEQCKHLGCQSTLIEWNEEDEEALENTMGPLSAVGYSTFKA